MVKSQFLQLFENFYLKARSFWKSWCIDRCVNLLKHAVPERVNSESAIVWCAFACRGPERGSSSWRMVRLHETIRVPTYSNNNGNDRGVNRPRSTRLQRSEDGRCLSASWHQPSARRFYRANAPSYPSIKLTINWLANAKYVNSLRFVENRKTWLEQSKSARWKRS